MNALPEANRPRPIISLVILLLMAGASIFMALFIIPKFEQIFQDALGPDHPLPGITIFIIAARLPLAIVTLLWSIAGIVAGWQRRRGAIWIINLGSLFFFVQIGITVIALFMPMNTPVTGGMSDAPLATPAASQ